MRRDLQDLVPELRNSELIFSVALRKGFARKPAHWIEIYRSQRGTISRYLMARQWGFTKKETGEKIIGENVSRGDVELQTVFQRVKDVLDSKIEAQWLLCEGQYNVDPPTSRPTTKEAKAIAAYTFDWMADFENTLESLRIKKEDLPRSMKFKAAQQKRKQKAEW